VIADLTPVQSRRLSIGLLAAAVLLLLAVTVLPVYAVNASYENRIASMQERLHRMQHIAAQDEELRQRYSALRRTQSSRGYFLEGDSEAVASADLQRILKSVTSQHDTQLMSTQILPAARENTLTRIALRVRVRGQMPGIVESVYALESNPVLLFIDNLSIRSAVSVRQRLRAQPQAQAQQAFDAEFDLIAYVAEAS